ncbi:MAG: hypothetical protein JO352_03875 [Chloroflexi bacterium]|nr:hypothetical protein [Chloroflexota bacterium]
MLTQILLTDEQLEAGLDDKMNWPSPGENLMMLSVEPEDLASRFRIKFQESWDDLDYLKVARLQTRSGKQFTLVRHRGTPAPGVLVTVGTGELAAASDFERELMEALEVTPEQVVWRAPTVNPWPWPGT